MSTRAINPGELFLQFQQSVAPLTVSHVAECPDLGPACFDGGPPPTPYNHHVDMLVSETSFTAALGIAPWFALESRWALRVTDVNPTYSELDGTPKSVPNDIHHHDETLVDITDPWLLARFAKTHDAFVISVTMGMSFPLGRTEEDPYRLGRQGKWHQHLQAGTGTVVPIVGLGLAYTIDAGSSVPVILTLNGIGFYNAYENDKGYRAPVRLYATHRIAPSFFERKLTPFFELTLAHEGEEYWHGEVGLEGSNVRSEVYIGGGLEWRFFENWTLMANARGRVATLTEAPTFQSLGQFMLGLSTSFDLWQTKEELAHTPQDGPAIRQTEKDGVIEYTKEPD